MTMANDRGNGIIYNQPVAAVETASGALATPQESEQ